MATTIADPSWVVVLDGQLDWVDGALAWDYDETQLFVALGSGTPTISPLLIEATTTVYNPTVTPGAVTVTVPLITATTTVYTPTITTGAVTVTVPRIEATTTVYSPVVTAGGLTVSPELIAATTTVYNPTVSIGAATVRPSLIASTVIVYNPTITGGEQQLIPYGPIHAYREPSTHTYREGRMSAQVTTTYRTVDEDPGIAYSWLDRDGSVIDLSGATFSLVVTNLQGATELTKTSGITGAATSPNVVISWDAGELASLGVGSYLYKLTATVSSRQRTLGAGTPHRLIVTA